MLNIIHGGIFESEFVLLVETAEVVEELACGEFLEHLDLHETHLLQYGNPLCGDAFLQILLVGVLLSAFLGLHLGEEEHILNGLLTRHKHCKSVDTDTHT